MDPFEIEFVANEAIAQFLQKFGVRRRIERGQIVWGIDDAAAEVNYA